MLPTRPRGRWSDRRVALLLGATTLLKGICWIALLPAFKIADEPSHYENVQYRGEHFAVPRATKPEPFGSTIHVGSPPDVQLVWKRSNELWRNRYLADVRSVHEEDVLRDMAADPATRDGTGRISSASYPGFYYDAAVPVYRLFHRTSILTRIAAVRCVSLFFGILAVVATFFAARLIMTSRALAIAAALVVMLQPMESQMTAAVNNDAGVIGLGALLFYLQLRFLVHAPEIPKLRYGIAMALVAVAIVFTKPHGYALLPGCAFACGWVVAQNLRKREAWIFAAVTAAIAAVGIVVSILEMRDTGQTAILPGAGAGGAALAIPATASPDFLNFLDRIDDGFVLYLYRSFFGQFGWLEYSIGTYWLDYVTKVWRLVEIGAVTAVVLRVTRTPGWRWLSMRGFLFSIYTALFVLGFILYAEHRFRIIGLVGVIQGRSLLFGLPALAVIAAASFGALVPARFRGLSAAALAVSAAAFNAAAMLTIFRYHYGS